MSPEEQARAWFIIGYAIGFPLLVLACWLIDRWERRRRR